MDLEPHAWLYHSWGVTHAKLLEMLREHFDTEKFGLGYVLQYLLSVVPYIVSTHQDNYPEIVAQGVGPAKCQEAGPHF